MKTRMMFLWMAAGMLALAACRGGEDKVSADSVYFEGAEPVDLSDVLDIYAESLKGDGDYSVSTALEGDSLGDGYGMLLFADTAFAVQLPQYAGSSQPFLADAEAFYNSCAFAFNLWSNHQVWVCELASPQEVRESIGTISADCIRDQERRAYASVYQDSLLLTIGDGGVLEWEEGDSSSDVFGVFCGRLNEKAYRFCSDMSLFADSLQHLATRSLSSARPLVEEYRPTAADDRLGKMLNSLNACQTFDRQCSLLLCWADCKEAEPEDEWVIAVAGRLMRSGRYNPFLSQIWLIWRCLYQYQYFGLSRDSAIPNEFYNGMCKQCFLTCLKWIERHPDDLFAMNCAAVLAGRSNLNRFGEYPFGNDAAVEKYYHLSGRYEDMTDEEEEAE